MTGDVALHPRMAAVSLFSGGDGLGLGVDLVIPHRVLVYVEREAYAAGVLVARMEEGTLAPAAVWSDVVTFDGRPLRGLVDLVYGGFPCQDISNAGKRAGLDGARSGLWSEYARIVDEVRPRYVFVENVAALISRGLDRVLADLAALGFDAEWICLRASDVGAPHRRNRIFLLAWDRERVADADAPGCCGVGCGGVLDGERSSHGDDADRRGGPGPEVGDADECGQSSSELDLRAGEPDPDGAGLWPPGPEDAGGWREYLLVRPDAEPAVCRGPHGLAGQLVDRQDRLRMLGNGVVPVQAAVALVVLWHRAFGEWLA